MRSLQIVVFVLGAVALLSSACFIGKRMGEDLWKAGVATMLGDVVMILLWPRRSP